MVTLVACLVAFLVSIHVVPGYALPAPPRPITTELNQGDEWGYDYIHVSGGPKESLRVGRVTTSPVEPRGLASKIRYVDFLARLLLQAANRN
jgi:hypothetical protein